MTSVLVPHMVRNPAVRDSVEPFLRQHVLPTYAHPEGFMRSIALDVLVAVEKAEFNWPAPEALEPHYRAALAALDDADLPTRVQGAIAIADMVSRHESVRGELSGGIGKVIQGARPVVPLVVCSCVRVDRPAEAVGRDGHGRAQQLHGDPR